MRRKASLCRSRLGLYSGKSITTPISIWVFRGITRRSSVAGKKLSLSLTGQAFHGINSPRDKHSTSVRTAGPWVGLAGAEFGTRENFAWTSTYFFVCEITCRIRCPHISGNRLRPDSEIAGANIEPPAGRAPSFGMFLLFFEFFHQWVGSVGPDF